MKPLRVLPILLGILLIASALVSDANASSNPYNSRHGVNFTTGNKYLHQNDISLGGPNSALKFSRSYNSQGIGGGFLGFGWRTSWSDRLWSDKPTLGDNPAVIVLRQSDGHMLLLSSSGTDTWTNQIAKKTVLAKTGTGDSAIYTLTKPDKTRHIFDGIGRLIKTSDRNNNSITITYDGDLLHYIDDDFGRRLTLVYNADSMLTMLSSPIGTFAYGYDTNKNLTSITKSDGGVVRYIYDSAHNLTGVFDENNVRVQTIVYDSEDRVTSSFLTGGSEAISIAYQSGYKRVITDSLGVATNYQLRVTQGVAKIASIVGPGCSSCGTVSDTNYLYDNRQQTTEATDAGGIKTTYTYDESGNVTRITKAADTLLASVTDMTYDPLTNRVLTITKPSIANPGQSTVTRMTYDANGNLISRLQEGYTGTTLISSQTLYTYTSYGQITSIDGPRTDITDTVTLSYYANDASQGMNRGNLHTVTNALGHITTFSNYNAFGQVTTITEPNGIVTTRVYNLSGLLVSATTAGLTTSYTHNPAGQLQTITLPGNRVITYSYTPAGKVARISDSLGNATAFSYDTEGRRTGVDVYDPQNVLTKYTDYGYDNYGRINLVTLPGSAQETAEYDLVGNLVKTINATLMATENHYDALHRLLSVAEAGNATAAYAYDAHGNITRVTDAKGKVTTFVYDDFGRKISRTAPDTGLTRYTYDAAGNLLTVFDAKGQTTAFTYDALNRPIDQSFAGGGNVVFAYDQGANAVGHLSMIIDQEGTATFAYDNKGRLATETRVIGTTSYTIAYGWDTATGDLAGMTYPSSLSLANTWDASGQITSMSVNGTPLVTAAAHLPFGPLKSATLGSVNLTRNYDQRYNASKIKAGSALEYDFTRDAGGHVTGIAGIQDPTAAARTSNYLYNPANNQLTGAVPKTFTYDSNGNMFSDGTFTYIYDGLNRMIRVEQQVATVASYGYDSMNRRIRKTVGTTTSHYLYDLNSRLIAEMLVDGTPIREYIYLDGEPIAVKEYQANPGIYYYVNDHLGTPQQLVSATGTVIWQAAYLPFGKAQVTTETVKNNLRFAGQYFDEETRLHYNLNRFYDPDTGRYITADRIGLDGGMNLYAYVANDPVNWIDPWGLAGIGRRPLQGDMPFNGKGPVHHAQIWYDDNGSSSGFFDDDKIRPDTGHTIDEYNFANDPRNYNDNRMRKAEQNVQKNWNKDWIPSFNDCQDYTDAVRDEYDRLWQEDIRTHGKSGHYK
jgi:RHS repeat-associated protein